MPTTEIGKMFYNLWNGQVYTMIKEVGGTLAIMTFVFSFIYFTWIGSSRQSVDTAKKLMVGSIGALLIIYAGPKVIQMFIDIFATL